MKFHRGPWTSKAHVTEAHRIETFSLELVTASNGFTWVHDREGLIITDPAGHWIYKVLHQGMYDVTVEFVRWESHPEGH